MGTQIWPCCKKVKGQPKIIIWPNLEDLVSPMTYICTKIQPQKFLGSGEDFQVFLPYMGMVAILFNGQEPFQ